MKTAPVGIRPGLFLVLTLLVALVAIVVTSQAPATPGVFSLDRLRLGSVAGPENYLYTAGNSIYPDGGIDAGAFYYRVVVTDTVADFATLLAEAAARGETHPGLVFALRPAFDRATPGVVGTMTRALGRLLRADEPIRGGHFLRPC